MRKPSPTKSSSISKPRRATAAGPSRPSVDYIRKKALTAGGGELQLPEEAGPVRARCTAIVQIVRKLRGNFFSDFLCLFPICFGFRISDFRLCRPAVPAPGQVRGKLQVRTSGEAPARKPEHQRAWVFFLNSAFCI